MTCLFVFTSLDLSTNQLAFCLINIMPVIDVFTIKVYYIQEYVASDICGVIATLRFILNTSFKI